MAQPVDVEVGDKVMVGSDRARDRDVEMDTIQTNSRYLAFLLEPSHCQRAWESEYW
jgi:hypothetical protein